MGRPGTDPSWLALLGLLTPRSARYLDIMTGAYVIRQLRPWRENLGKRIVKASRIYVADSGLLHTLLGVETEQDLRAHPKVGASWEGFALEQVVRQLKARPEECYFWSVHSGPELDLLVVRDNGDMVTNSSAPMLPGSRDRCGQPWDCFASTVSTSST